MLQDRSKDGHCKNDNGSGAPEGSHSPPPLPAADFSTLLTPLGPFETKPHLAVAVSGGADSMALGLLAAEWTDQRKGQVTVLTVDHGIRPEAQEEVIQVQKWMMGHGIKCNVLTVPLPINPPNQEQARNARYRILSEWCRQHHVLHLLTAHHAGDQAETVLLRQQKNSGLDGLAAMSPVKYLNNCRLLRPLLLVDSGRLRATLRSKNQPWIEDPSNKNQKYSRVRARQHLAADMADGTTLDLLAIARLAARQRHVAEQETAALAARTTILYPSGFCTIKQDAFRTAELDTSERLLAQLLTCISGKYYPPPRESVQKILANFRETAKPTKRSLHGCLIVPGQHDYRIFREAGRVTHRARVQPEKPTLWDGRYTLKTQEEVVGLTGASYTDLEVSLLGEKGWNLAIAAAPWLRKDCKIPYPARLALPALWRGSELVAAPHLRLIMKSPAAPVADPCGKQVVASFTPHRAFGEAAFVIPPDFDANLRKNQQLDAQAAN